MRAYLSVQFDKPVEKGCYAISSGSYAVRIECGTKYLFDFYELTGGIDEENMTVVHFQLKDEDCETFPDIIELKKHLHEITSIEECCIDIERGESPEIFPIRILEFVIEDWVKGCPMKPKSSRYVTVKEEKRKGGSIFTYVFTEKLLATFNRSVP